MKQVIGGILFCVGILSLMLGAMATGFAANEIYFLRPTKDAASVSFMVKEGERASAVIDELVKLHLISSPLLFKLYVRARHLEGSIQIGTFSVMRGTSMSRLLKILTHDGDNEITITIPEGWTAEEIGTYLETQGFSKKEVLSNTGLWGVVSLEGFLFPDTYRVWAHGGTHEVIDKMTKRFLEQTNPYFEISKKYQVFYQKLIMASIVEREVAGTEDRKKVADIFWRRLAIGMPLQADSTVNYVTHKKTPSISSQDRATDSPYNTYRIKGLPPTPISNPGLDAIRAALEPTKNNYWYFLTDPKGNVHYAITLDEHNKNKARYLK